LDQKEAGHPMKRQIRNFILSCEALDFGKVELSKMETTFYWRFNNEIVSFCKSLPGSIQSDTILFLMRYSGINLGDKLDFFAHYYPPAWSILYWLSHTNALPKNRLKEGDITNAVIAQSMAMLLHSLDDHLTDGQVSVSHLTLLLRSQAWTIMNRAFFDLAEGVPSGKRTVQNFIDDYYSSMMDSKGLKSLDKYCDLFRKQMAIWMIAPILLSVKMIGTSAFTREIETAYGSFGIAWRLLDDLKDIGEDIEKGSNSAIYLCLPKMMRNYWTNYKNKSRFVANDSLNTILNYILENSLIEKIKKRICSELESAESIVEAYGLKGFAREFRCLSHPLRKNVSAWKESHGKEGASLAAM
jgi:hypothetical protein